MITTAIVRPPSARFAHGLSTAGLGPPDLARALDQHERYCRALEHCGAKIIRLAPDTAHPDSTFVEDVAVVTGSLAVLTRPGATSRRGEVATMRVELAQHFDVLEAIEPPGTLEGGDICETGDRLFIGISARTNEEGARQLAALVAPRGLKTTFVRLAPEDGLLHLKSAIAHLGDGRLVLAEPLLGRPEFSGYEIVRVEREESYAANCVRVNDHVLVAAGFPRFDAALRDLGLAPIALDMSEFRKMDGGLSCLSLRLTA